MSNSEEISSQETSSVKKKKNKKNKELKYTRYYYSVATKSLESIVYKQRNKYIGRKCNNIDTNGIHSSAPKRSIMFMSS